MKAICVLLLFSFYMRNAHAQPAKELMQTYQLIFQSYIGDSVLNFDSTYQNHFGEVFKVRSFKYYISHIRLKYNDGKTYSLPASLHLINDADSTSKSISFVAPAGKINGIQFLSGIDSITNVSGVQTGDLDPAKGMFWIWNTGYIMAKLEGSSIASKAPGKQYTYDIGGYKKDENVAREINLSLPTTTNNQSSAFIITANIGKWFYGKNNIKILEQPMCHSPGTLAMQIADNYMDMFSIRAR